MKKIFAPLIALAVAAFSAVIEKVAASIEGYMWNSGLVLGAVPNMADAQRFRATDPNMTEVIGQRLYDHVLYPAAGRTNLALFSFPMGQGVTTDPSAAVGAPKTYADTNMNSAGQLPSGKSYKMEQIEIYFYPGTSAAANTFIPAFSTTATTGAFSATVANAPVDVQSFYEAGTMEFNILDKNQLRETPLRSFPPSTWMKFDAAVGGAVGAVPLNPWMVHAYPDGLPGYLNPPTYISPTESFSVNLIWASNYALPSGFNARVGVYFSGFLFRAVQ